MKDIDFEIIFIILAIGFIVALVFTPFIVSDYITGARISEAIQNGTDPLAARCAFVKDPACQFLFARQN